MLLEKDKMVPKDRCVTEIINNDFINITETQQKLNKITMHSLIVYCFSKSTKKFARL